MSPQERIARLRGWKYLPQTPPNEVVISPDHQPWPDIAWALDVAEAALRVDTTFAHFGEPWSPTDHTNALRTLRERLYARDNERSHE